MSNAALSNDNSWGFELTSIQAAYIIERLNEVFGPSALAGVTIVAFQYRVDGENGCLRAE